MDGLMPSKDMAYKSHLATISLSLSRTVKLPSAVLVLFVTSMDTVTRKFSTSQSRLVRTSAC